MVDLIKNGVQESCFFAYSSQFMSIFETIHSWSQSILRLIEYKNGQIDPELVYETINSEILVQFLMESHHQSWDPDVFLPCFESILGILVNLFYQESKTHVQSLARLDIVSVLFSLGMNYPELK